jgi:hypothetical protein
MLMAVLLLKVSEAGRVVREDFLFGIEGPEERPSSISAIWSAKS